MKKMLTIASFLLSGLLYADVDVWVCDVEQVDGDTHSFTVCVNSPQDIFGWQFGIDVAGFTTESIALGADAAAVNGAQINGTFFPMVNGPFSRSRVMGDMSTEQKCNGG